MSWNRDRVWCLSTGVVWCLLLLCADATFCPQEPTYTGPPKFTKKLGSKDFIRYGHAIAIVCCAAGYENITWHRYDRWSSVWEPFPPPSTPTSYNTPKLEENGQLLRLFTTSEADNTTFRCRVIGDGPSLTHDMKLNVVRCDVLPDGPQMYSPPPASAPGPRVTAVKEYGSDINITCEGYFGCGRMKNALWKVSSGADFVPLENVSKRYSQYMYNKGDGIVLGSLLTVSEFSAEDEKHLFMCILATPQVHHGIVNRTVRILYSPDPEPQEPVLPFILLGVIGGLVLILIVLLIVYWLYRPTIKLACRTYCCCNSDSTKILSETDYDHNAFLYHAVEDEETARVIKEKLEKLNYSVFLNSDVKGNQPTLATYEKQIKRSARTVFLCSDNLCRDGLANFLLQNLIEYYEGKRILLVVKKDIPVERMKDWMKKAKVKDVTEGEEHEIEATQENSDNARRKDGDIDMEFWKLPRIYFPKEKTSKRKEENFWCEFQLNLPKFDHQLKRPKSTTSSIEKSSRGRNSASSGRPLLSVSETEAGAPVFLGIETECTPNHDQVFQCDVNPPQVPVQGQGRRRRHRAGTYSDSDIDVQPSNHDVIVDVHRDDGRVRLHGSLIDDGLIGAGSPGQGQEAGFIESSGSWSDVNPRAIPNSYAGHNSESGYDGSVSERDGSLSNTGLSPPVRSDRPIFLSSSSSNSNPVFRENSLPESNIDSSGDHETNKSEFEMSQNGTTNLPCRHSDKNVLSVHGHGNDNGVPKPLQLKIHDRQRQTSPLQSSLESGYITSPDRFMQSIDGQFIPAAIPEQS